VSKEEESKSVRIPKEGELLGEVIQSLGYDRVKVRCEDNEIRICRIPGKFKKKEWLKEGDIVLVLPWYGMQEKTRGDLLHIYKRAELKELEKLNYLSRLKGES
jgi:translation initiation factor 1A